MKSTTLSIVEPAPTCVVVVDLDSPMPEQLGGDGYQTAMVIGERNGIPRSSAIIDLRASGPTLRSQLEPLFRAGSDDVDFARASVPDGDLPSISVVVPTMVERAEDLELLLVGLAGVDYPDVEFIRMDQVNEAYERLLMNDVRYRFVIDMSHGL